MRFRWRYIVHTLVIIGVIGIPLFFCITPSTLSKLFHNIYSDGGVITYETTGRYVPGKLKTNDFRVEEETFHMDQIQEDPKSPMDNKTVTFSKYIPIADSIYPHLPHTISSYNTLWQNVQKFPIIRIFSAFYDDRPALEKHSVRIVSVSEESTKRSLDCIFWYKNMKRYKRVKLTERIIGPPSGADEKLFVPYLFSCDHEKKDIKPAHVSVVPANAILGYYPVTTYLQIQYPIRPRNKLKFGACVSVAYWKHDPYRIVEWMEMQKLWGVEEVTVYNSSLSKEAMRVFSHYVREGFVDLRSLPLPVKEDGEGSFLLNMSPSLNDCMYRNIYRYSKIAVTDFDEMIVPAMHNNYSDLLKAIDEAEDQGHPAPSYMFRNAYFFLDFGDVTPDPWYLTTTRYLRRIGVSPYGYSVKSITDPRVCISLQNHLCWSRIKKYDEPNWFVDVAPIFAKNQHYKRCHFDKFLQKPGTCMDLMKTYYKDETVLRFKHDIEKKVRERLDKIGLPLEKSDNVYKT